MFLMLNILYKGTDKATVNGTTWNISSLLRSLILIFNERIKLYVTVESTMINT
jgi:hypothetical protein